MFDWRRFVDLADSFAESDAEAELRTAISSAYYTVYHVAIEKVRDRGILRARTHRIWVELQEVGRSQGRSDLITVGVIGFELKRRREQADYHSPFDRDHRRQSPIDELTKDTLVVARELLRLIDALEE